MFASAATYFCGVMTLIASIMYFVAGLALKEEGELMNAGEPSLKQKTALAMVGRVFAVRERARVTVITERRPRWWRCCQSLNAVY
jgi:hypothetical protein